MSFYGTPEDTEKLFKKVRKMKFKEGSGQHSKKSKDHKVPTQTISYLLPKSMVTEWNKYLDQFDCPKKDIVIAAFTDYMEKHKQYNTNTPKLGERTKGSG